MKFIATVITENTEDKINLEQPVAAGQKPDWAELIRQAASATIRQHFECVEDCIDIDCWKAWVMERTEPIYGGVVFEENDEEDIFIQIDIDWELESGHVYPVED